MISSLFLVSSQFESAIATATDFSANNYAINNTLSSNVTSINTLGKLPSTQEYDKIKNCNQDTSKIPSSEEYLTYFNCCHVKLHNLPNGTQQVIREFTVVIKENQSIPIADNGLVFEKAWTFNGTIPGPTMRVTEGDKVMINVINDKQNNHTHSLHLHSTHPADMDGVDGPSGQIRPGQNFTYTFIAQPYGIYPYHCHVTPIEEHINNGLYGAFIIDPKTLRPAMKEMVMMMNGYDLDYEKEGSDQVVFLLQTRSRKIICLKVLSM